MEPITIGAGVYVDFTSIYNEWIDNSNYVALLHVEWGNTDNSYVILRFDNVLRFHRTGGGTGTQLSGHSALTVSTFFRSSTNDDDYIASGSSVTAIPGELYWFRCNIDSIGNISENKAGHLNTHNTYIKPWRSIDANTTRDPICLKYDGATYPLLYLGNSSIRIVANGPNLQSTLGATSANGAFATSIIFIRSTDANKMFPDNNDWLY